MNSQIISDKSQRSYGLDNVVFLGFIVLARGLKPNPSKIKLIVEWPFPRAIEKWSKEAEEAFNLIKTAISNALNLVPSDFDKLSTMDCDASHVGIGAAFS
ncbi:hypothetical protein RJ640_019189 [Escallonia rubra]|uniref:Reverse transcriptase/retrotransposon-derived protein RNase H-like domain-containing protein n=1 Tax=Escallonia rubra TaxID=112253 RepID=A0AA88RB21_9ASTE|nr:hypothetical protein RJ640_019189 [Escallonia rubra]